MKKIPSISFALAVVTVATAPAWGQELNEAAKKNIRKAVAARDADKDGKVTGQELFSFALSRAKDPEKANKQKVAMAIRWELARIDTDRDGAITAEEIGADFLALAVHKKSIDPEDAKLFEMRFSQCSYNALASALIHFHGATPKFEDRGAIEKTAFTDPLKLAKFGGYHGWGPWTSYMVNSETIEWNGNVTDLEAENFALRPAKLPVTDAKKRMITIRYEPGEREKLEQKFLAQLKRGPVIMWTPYAAVMSPVPERWKHVSNVDDHTDVVPFGPFTHAVTFRLGEDDRIVVFDGSTKDGIYESDLRTAVATSSAMNAFIRIRPPGEGKKTILERSRGVEDDKYNVVVFRKVTEDSNNR